MKASKIYLYAIAITVTAFALPSCKAKKAITKPTEPVVVTTPAPVTKAPVAATPAPVKTVVPAPEKPDYNFKNVQFELNSSILKTNAIEQLDAIASEMKKFPSSKFYVNGYASFEGTAAHNMELSIDRANSVKTYLSNSGVSSANLNAKGHGTSDPVASNDTESGRELNRRVEVRVIN